MGELDRNRILIVEDSEDEAQLLERQLRRISPALEVLRVDTERDMRAALAGSTWDLVISDHSMPSFDSDGALRVLRASGQDIPFILYSGALNTERGASAMQVGANDWVDKHDPARLMPVVERELRNVRIRRDKDRVERSMIEMSKYDALTRLPNLALFTKLVQVRLAESPGAGATPAVMYIDLDRFMRINDSLGYAAGDGLIRQVAARLRTAAPPGTVVARLGQDKFALFYSPADGGGGPVSFAERLAQRFGDPFSASGQEFFVTLSIGISLYPAHGADPATLLKNAESAMHVVKRLRGNGCQIYEAGLQQASAENLRMENELRHSIKREQLFLMFQPIFDLRTHRIVGAEALVRWKHPELGMIPPDRFIGLADETGQIHAIGEWVLARACASAQRWIRAGHDGVDVAVNFSATQFRHERFAARVRSILKASGLPPARLEMEITEGAAMQDPETTVDILGELKQAGIRVAIDDFGTGYSSLSYLKRLPLDILKIDKSFVRDLPQDVENVAIVRTIVALGKALRLHLHPEGVETPAQLEFLRSEGCDRAQGYLLSKPVLVEDFMALLARHNGAPAVNDDPAEAPSRHPVLAGALVAGAAVS